MIMKEGRKQNVLHFKVSDAELGQILQMQQKSSLGNLSSFLRKMVLEGYVLRLDIPEIQEMIRLLSNMTANINQIAKRENTGGHIYETELYEIQENQQELWKVLRQILSKLESCT